ncbi:MAG: amidohydrolase family protein [Bacteroidota bacterium]
MRIDAHCHFWKYDPIVHEWIKDELAILRKDRLPIHLESNLSLHEIDGVVAVQALPTEQETQFLVDLAKNSSIIKGVVGWINFNTHQLDKQLDILTSCPELKGFRHLLHSAPPGFLTQSSFIQQVKTLGRYGFSYDILITEHQLAETVAFIKEVDGHTKLVVNHIAKPAIKNKSFSQWSKGIEAMSHFPEVYVKISGLVTQADWVKWQASDFEPYLSATLDYFGPERLMFGSDWPISSLAANYTEVIDLITSHCTSLSNQEKEQIFGRTASNFYRLE